MSDYMKQVDSVLGASIKTNIPAVLIGDPGTGKTEFIRELAKTMNHRLIVILGNSMDPTDVSGMPVREQLEDGSYVTNYAYPKWAQLCIEDATDKSPYDGTIVFFDELNTSPPAVQAALLTVLQSRHLPSGVQFPDTTKFLAAMNESEDAADGWDLAGPMANRLMHIQWAPPASVWYEGMLGAWGKDVTMEELKARATVVAFVRENPQFLNGKPQDDAVAAGHAWPSRRSWDNAARVFGVMGDIPDIPMGEVSMVAAGLVGNAAAARLCTWLAGFTLPDPEKVLADPESIDWDEMSSDKAYAVIGSVIPFAGSERAEEMAHVLVVASDSRVRDVVAPFVGPFFRSISSADSKLDRVKAIRGITKNLGDLLSAAGISPGAR